MKNPLLLLAEIIAPDYCLGCGECGEILCDNCSAGIWFPDQCYRCRRVSAGSLTCFKCTTRYTPDQVCFIGSLDGLAAELVQSAKYTPSRSSARRMGKLLKRKLPYLDHSTAVVVHIPTSNDHVRVRGYDQAKEVSKAISGLPNSNLLRRKIKSHQVGSTRKQRFDNMKDAFELKREIPDHIQVVVLVDDVLTTGATLESAAKVIKKHKPVVVIGAIFARAV